MRTADRPSAWAASVWPLGSDCRPPRTISAMYAAVNSVMATMARSDERSGWRVELGQEQRDDEVRQQQQHVQRHAAEQLDVDDAQPADERQLRAPAEGEQHAEREAQRDAGDGEEHVEHQPAPRRDRRAAPAGTGGARRTRRWPRARGTGPTAAGQARPDEAADDAGRDGRRRRSATGPASSPSTGSARCRRQRPQPRGGRQHALATTGRSATPASAVPVSPPAARRRSRRRGR